MSDIGFVWVEWPYARIRRELATEGGDVIRFVFQLEYDAQATRDGHPPHDWRQVARFDHDVSGQHDIGIEGLHLDIYRDGEKWKKTWDFPDIEPRQAPDFCQQYLLQNADYFLDQFERWHDVGKEWR